MSVDPISIQEFQKFMGNVHSMQDIVVSFIPLGQNKTVDAEKGFDIKENYSKITLTEDQVKQRLLHDLNYGIYALRNGLCFIDIDTKNGKLNIPYDKLQELINVFDTFCVRTRNGGYHFYFHNDTDGVNNSLIYFNETKVGEIRKEWQYVVGVGSYYSKDNDATSDGTGRYKVFQNKPFKKFSSVSLPSWLTVKNNITNREETRKIKSEFKDIYTNELGRSLTDIRKIDHKLDSLLSGPNADGYPSRSEADFAAATKLCFWRFSESDIASILQYHRGYEKTNREDYLSHTVCKAVSSCTEQYTPRTYLNRNTGSSTNPTPPKDDQSYDFDCSQFEKTDLGNSKRLIVRYGSDIRYCHIWKTWYIWDGIRWCPDERGEILNLARDTVVRIADEAKLVPGDTERADLFKWAASSQSYKRIRDMVTLSTIPEISILPTDLDTIQNIINFPNGTLNLDTFELIPHNKEDMCSMVMGVEYDVSARCDKWLNQMELVFQKDKEKIDFFQELCGYFFLYDHPMQNMFIHHGDGKNGRSVIFRVLEKVFNDYAGAFPTELLLYHKLKNAEPKGQPELLSLIGKRLLIAKETDKGRSLSESAIKKYTGGDTERTRLLHNNRMQSFQGTFKINLLTNHMPHVRGTDQGIRRRLVKVPYFYEIPEEDRRPFNEMVDELFAEGPGIINWMVGGLIRVLQNRRMINLIESVSSATTDYLKREDMFGRFLDDECIVRKDIPKDECITPTRVQSLFKEWAEREGEDMLKATHLKDEMQRRFGDPQRTNSRRYYTGVREKTAKEREDDADHGDAQKVLLSDKVTEVTEKTLIFMREPLREKNIDNTVTSVTQQKTTDEKKEVTNPQTTPQTVTNDSVTRRKGLVEFFEKLGIGFIPDTSRYKLIEKQIVGRCIVKGCKENPIWEMNGRNFLCCKHYELSKTMIEEYEYEQDRDGEQ